MVPPIKPWRGPTMSQVLTQAWFPKFKPSKLGKITIPAWRITTFGPSSQLALCRQTDGKPHTTTWENFFDGFSPASQLIQSFKGAGYTLDATQSNKQVLVFLPTSSGKVVFDDDPFDDGDANK